MPAGSKRTMAARSRNAPAEPFAIPTTASTFAEVGLISAVNVAVPTHGQLDLLIQPAPASCRVQSSRSGSSYRQRLTPADEESIFETRCVSWSTFAWVGRNAAAAASHE